MEERRLALEQTMREATDDDASRVAVTAAAREYREMMAESPEALRTIARAFSRVRDHRAGLEVLRTLVSRGQATREDRFDAIELMLHMANEGKIRIDHVAYEANLEWLRGALEHEQRCSRFMTLVEWTNEHPEELDAIERALGVCRDETRRAQLYAARARLRDSAEDACDAVVNGVTTLAGRCIEMSGSSWKVDVARVLVENASDERLRAVTSKPDVTSFVLQRFASAVTVSNDEACVALKRAEQIELAWYPDEPDHRAHTIGFFEPLKRGRCKR